MNKPNINKQCVNALFESRFLNVFDLQYDSGKHYYNATRRSLEDLAATKTEEEFKKMIPDAVSCIVIVKLPGEEPKLLLSYEFRYPTGQFLLSVPAGLVDPEDAAEDNPVLVTAAREIEEETGLKIKPSDTLTVVNPLLFSTPGMTDESNALVLAVIELQDLSELTQSGAVGSECFDGFSLLSREEAQTVFQNGCDQNGIFYSMFTWAALACFVGDLWKMFITTK